jgi:ADP-ribose pyrophosphatase
MEKRLIAEGKFLRLVTVGRWEVAERVRANGVVIVVPRLDDGRWVLIEQTRPAVGGRSIEFPAGLSGDSIEDADELLSSAAIRELMEETGYQASDIYALGTASSSPGVTSEIMTFFLATGLTKVTSGGGVGTEDIITHLVADDEIDGWLKERPKEALVSAMVLCGLFLARKYTHPSPGMNPTQRTKNRV